MDAEKYLGNGGHREIPLFTHERKSTRGQSRKRIREIRVRAKRLAGSLAAESAVYALAQSNLCDYVFGFPVAAHTRVSYPS